MGLNKQYSEPVSLEDAALNEEEQVDETTESTEETK